MSTRKINWLIGIRQLKRLDDTIIDTAMASALNLASVFIIGAVYGISVLGEFSLILIYSSFVYLFSYNFIIIPATSKSWKIPNSDFVSKITILSIIAFIILTSAALAFDNFVLKFSMQSVFLSFFYIVSHNTFLTIRRILLHLRIARYPTLIPFVVLGLLAILAGLNIVSYDWFILSYSASFVLVVGVFLVKNIGRDMLPSLALVGQFLKFSRWMALGIWFQWLSGNVVQLLVQYHLGTDSLGLLRILLSSFGFLSVYFQYREIVLAREQRNEQQARIRLASVLDVRRYLVPVLLIALCIPIYLVYSKLVGVLPLVNVAIIYAVYQFLVLISVILRVYLRIMNDMFYAFVGYCAMVLTIIPIEILVGSSFELITAAYMYLASISVMVFILIIGLKRISNAQG